MLGTQRPRHRDADSALRRLSYTVGGITKPNRSNLHLTAWRRSVASEQHHMYPLAYYNSLACGHSRTA